MTQNIATPMIVIIDLDGTIIGDITPQIISYELTNALKKVNVKNPFDIGEFRAKLKNGLMRPYFATFIRGLKANYPTIEFFIYTASEKTWAEFVIKNIEKVLGIKFNRPIMSRNYCLNQDKEYKKGLQYISPTLIKCLKKTYKIQFTKNDLLRNLLIIDNNNVYQAEEQKHLLICPTYNYRVAENIIANITSDIYKTHYNIINTTLRRYIPLSNTSDFNLFQKEFYTYYVHYLTSIIKTNARYSNDKYWLHLKDIIITQNIQKLDDRNIRYISAIMRQRTGTIRNSE
jgi:hypothetical protein